MQGVSRVAVGISPIRTMNVGLSSGDHESSATFPMKKKVSHKGSLTDEKIENLMENSEMRNS
ncbi:hypothetical protein Arcve_0196 [Archaeoglobus veneficus SNP6]|uniref:Uncharacterized protein n=1 Tax=Archaeoglobus veneficus (strain DSM 11195 / SNP6) TaxID=693661 RepID=F2KNK6_ARCVS|nr:hypothetical protein Arcve_0196 [Archaeoglobus veneficus SNP6]